MRQTIRTRRPPPREQPPPYEEAAILSNSHSHLPSPHLHSEIPTEPPPSYTLEPTHSSAVSISSDNDIDQEYHLWLTRSSALQLRDSRTQSETSTGPAQSTTSNTTNPSSGHITESADIRSSAIQEANQSEVDIPSDTPEPFISDHSSDNSSVELTELLPLPSAIPPANQGPSLQAEAPFSSNSSVVSQSHSLQSDPVSDVLPESIVLPPEDNESSSIQNSPETIEAPEALEVQEIQDLQEAFVVHETPETPEAAEVEDAPEAQVEEAPEAEFQDNIPLESTEHDSTDLTEATVPLDSAPTSTELPEPSLIDTEVDLLAEDPIPTYVSEFDNIAGLIIAPSPHTPISLTPSTPTGTTQNRADPISEPMPAPSDFNLLDLDSDPTPIVSYQPRNPTDHLAKMQASLRTQLQLDQLQLDMLMFPRSSTGSNSRISEQSISPLDPGPNFFFNNRSRELPSPPPHGLFHSPPSSPPSIRLPESPDLTSSSSGFHEASSFQLPEQALPETPLNDHRGSNQSLATSSNDHRGSHQSLESSFSFTTSYASPPLQPSNSPSSTLSRTTTNKSDKSSSKFGRLRRSSKKEEKLQLEQLKLLTNSPDLSLTVDDRVHDLGDRISCTAIYHPTGTKPVKSIYFVLIMKEKLRRGKHVLSREVALDMKNLTDDDLPADASTQDWPLNSYAQANVKYTFQFTLNFPLIEPDSGNFMPLQQRLPPSLLSPELGIDISYHIRAVVDHEFLAPAVNKVVAYTSPTLTQSTKKVQFSPSYAPPEFDSRAIASTHRRPSNEQAETVFNHIYKGSGGITFKGLLRNTQAYGVVELHILGLQKFALSAPGDSEIQINVLFFPEPEIRRITLPYIHRIQAVLQVKTFTYTANGGKSGMFTSYPEANSSGSSVKIQTIPVCDRQISKSGWTKLPNPPHLKESVVIYGASHCVQMGEIPTLEENLVDLVPTYLSAYSCREYELSISVTFNPSKVVTVNVPIAISAKKEPKTYLPFPTYD